MKAAKLLKVRDRNLFAIPDIDAINRIGRIPIAKKENCFWIPIWRISSSYNEHKVATILKMTIKKLGNFAIAFENESNYLILSDESLDEEYANEILSKIKKRSQK
jgi:hypothetical protein